MPAAPQDSAAQPFHVGTASFRMQGVFFGDRRLGTSLRGHIPGPLSSTSIHFLKNTDRKSTRLSSSHVSISYAVFCLKKKKKNNKIIFNNYKTNTILLTIFIRCLLLIEFLRHVYHTIVLSNMFEHRYINYVYFYILS